MRIGEVSKQLGIPVETLRYYDHIGLVVPQRHKGIRNYCREDLQKLSAVAKMKRLMFSLEEIHTILSADEQVDKSLKNGNADIQAIQELLTQLQTKDQEITQLETNLAEVKAQLSTLMDKVQTALRENQE